MICSVCAHSYPDSHLCCAARLLAVPATSISDEVPTKVYEIPSNDVDHGMAEQIHVLFHTDRSVGKPGSGECCRARLVQRPASGCGVPDRVRPVIQAIA